jgi:hypothetical protein
MDVRNAVSSLPEGGSGERDRGTAAAKRSGASETKKDRSPEIKDTETMQIATEKREPRGRDKEFNPPHTLLQDTGTTGRVLRTPQDSSG